MERQRHRVDRRVQPAADADQLRPAHPHRPRGRVRVPLRPVQHRRPGPVPRSARSWRVWVGSALPGLPERRHILFAIDRRRARGRALGGHRRLPQGDRRRARGDLDDHAQLDRDLGRRLPVRARRTAPERHAAVRAGLERRRRRARSCRSSGATRSCRPCTSASSSRSPRSSSTGSSSTARRSATRCARSAYNPEAARYGGITVARNYFLAMAISGAFAGLAGAIDILGWQYRLNTNDVRSRRRSASSASRSRCSGATRRSASALSALLFAALADRDLDAQPRPGDLPARAGVEPDA